LGFRSDHLRLEHAQLCSIKPSGARGQLQHLHRGMHAQYQHARKAIISMSL
jgi:hypothetical protein